METMDILILTVSVIFLSLILVSSCIKINNSDSRGDWGTVITEESHNIVFRGGSVSIYTRGECIYIKFVK